MQFRDFVQDKVISTREGVGTLCIYKLSIYLDSMDCLDQPSNHAGWSGPGCVHVVHAALSSKS